MKRLALQNEPVGALRMAFRDFPETGHWRFQAVRYTLDDKRKSIRSLPTDDSIRNVVHDSYADSRQCQFPISFSDLEVLKGRMAVSK